MRQRSNLFKSLASRNVTFIYASYYFIYDYTVYRTIY